MKKLCVFDLDGTLVNSIYDIAAALNASLEEMNLPGWPLEEYYRMVGDGMEMLCRRAIPGGTEEQVQTLVGLYNRCYQRDCCVLTQPYEGIPQLMKRLRQNGMLTAVLSNKPHEQTLKVVATLLPEADFLAVRGQSPEFPRKPDPAALYALMELAEVLPQQTVYIGDSDVDMLLGKNAGVDTIGVSWGFRGTEELNTAGACAIAHTAKELEDLLFIR